MNSGTGSDLEPRIFYGWWLALAGFVIGALGEAGGHLSLRLPPRQC